MKRNELNKLKISLMKERNPENKILITATNEIFTKIKDIAVKEKKSVDEITAAEVDKAIVKIYNEAIQEKEGLITAKRDATELTRKVEFLENWVPKVKSAEEVSKEIDEILSNDPQANFVIIINKFKENKDSYDMGLVSKIIKEKLN